MSDRVHVGGGSPGKAKSFTPPTRRVRRARPSLPFHGLRLFLNRRDPRRKPSRCFVDQIDYYYIFLQKIQCTFKIDVPDMGHLGGGSDKDVCSYQPCKHHHAQLGPPTDQGFDKGPAPDVVGVHLSLFVGLSILSSRSFTPMTLAATGPM